MVPNFSNSQDMYAVILAGRDPARPMPLSRRIAGRSKQYWRTFGQSTLLGKTHRRVALAINSRRIIVVLTKKDDDFNDRQTCHSAQPMLVIQPRDCGSGPAILYALIRLAKLNPDAVVSVFPSHQHTGHGRLFTPQLHIAMWAARLHPAHVVLLGIRPDRAESHFDWIEPVRYGTHWSSLLKVARIWEKPPSVLAQSLWSQGCLVNSYVMTGTVRAFLGLAGRTLPEVMRAFTPIWLVLGTKHEAGVIEQVYARLPHSDFSRDVLARNARALLVFPVEGACRSSIDDRRLLHGALARDNIGANWEFRSRFERFCLSRCSTATAPGPRKLSLFNGK
jgi:mannose-1-phosphate guanylyltransferase